MTSEPLVAAGLFRAVVAEAGGRCQCEGACGQPHAKTDGRCSREHDHYAGKHGGPVRLMAAAADPLTPERHAAALPASKLRAWCPQCFTAARRAAQHRTQSPTADQCGLFDL
ncbi:hypothetical protein ACFO9E_27475 [Streptomyces maoxianensis]|uniref:HNH endonuclease n=1 Tax=Streptomyces maoxianensis TaxID=1459942 RepID=A0ABV9GB29_9ACTN